MVAQQWEIEGPRVLDVGDEHERVTKLEVGIVGGRVDVVTHDDSPTARVEVTSVEGLPLRVSWDGGTLRIIHGKDNDKNVMEMLKRTFETFGRNRVTLSISVPVDARTTVSTVSAAAFVSGVRSTVKVNTVSGALTVSDLEGGVDLNTVSGSVDGEDLVGPATVNTVSGAVTLQGSDLPDVKINTVSGDIVLDLTTATSRIRSNSVSGDVTVRAPLGGFDIEGNTASGQVVVDGRQLSRGFTGYGAGHGSHGRDRGGHLREGDGALQIKANAVSGSIVVLRSSGADDDSVRDRTPPAPQDAPTGEHPADAGFGPPFQAPSEQPAAHPSDQQEGDQPGEPR